jgi:peptide/nickel transport system substrate-binding protein
MGKWGVKVSELPQDVQQFYKYDPAQAKKLLNAAGFTEAVIQLAYMTTSPSGIKHVEAIGNMLNAVGVKTSLVAQDYNKDFVDEGHGSRQGFFPKNMIGWFNQAAYSDADQWLFTYFASRSTSNQEHLKDPTYDAMIDKERTQVNEADRLKAIRDILTYFADKMYAPNSVSPPEWIAVQPRIHNYQFSSTLGIGTETYAKLWISA